MRSLRSILALRVGLGALAVALLLSLGALLFLRARLRSTLDASLLELAELEAAFGADSLTAAFHFRSDRFRLPSGGSELGFWAQLLTSQGMPLVLSANLAGPLPVPEQALGEANLGRPTFVTQRSPGTEGRGGPGRIPLRTVIYPMEPTGPAHSDHRLQVSTTLVPYRRTIRDFALLALVVSLSGALFAWLVARAVANRALTPALELARSVEAIGVRELGRRVTVPGHLEEFHLIAVAFNGLLDRIEQAVTGTRRFTSDASHELRAPLTVLRGELELALSRPRSTAEYTEVLRRCLDEVLRLSRLADDLLTLARVEGGATGGVREPVDLDELAARALERKQTLAGERSVTLDLAGSAGLVQGDPDLLLRALDGMIEHAIMASTGQGRVRVRLSARDGARAILVTGTGPGLDPAEAAGLFQRFHRSPRDRTHSPESGLGLAIARLVAERHGGGVEFAGNDPGASFRLTLPASSSESDG